jgi:GDPmannose 4,6-dehydratase
VARTALITGIRGQDGAYLAQFLLRKGYVVVGADRRSGESNHWRLKRLEIASDVRIVYCDLLEYSNVLRTLQEVKPDEIYNLAAQSFVKASFEHPMVTTQVNSLGVLNLLEAIRAVNPKIKFYQASTSEMFGKVRETPQTEMTPFHPRSPYGVAKLYGHFISVNYRESYDMFACSGLLFNHESPLRGSEFVTRKIAISVAAIARGHEEKLVLGNMDAKRDWGYAPEYVEGMWMMLQQSTADDYVLATGETHSVREFVTLAFDIVGMPLTWEGTGAEECARDPKGVVRVAISPEFYRPAEVDYLVGNPSKAKKQLGWSSRTPFARLVELMVRAELDPKPSV